MNGDLAIHIEGASKKYCKTLRRSMLYGLEDVTRNAFGVRSRSEKLRKDEFWAVDDVSLEIKRGETVGLIGPNGSGKTTLLKMVNGIFWPDRGKLSVRGRVGALIAVGAGFHPLLTGRENIYVNAAIMGMNRREVDERFGAIVDFAEIGDFLDAPVKAYSSGMFVRLGFAVAVHANPDIMLVDEVLAVGDRGFQSKCLKKMAELRDQGTTFLLVSHNMHTVAGFVDWVALLHKGKMERFDDVFAAIERYGLVCSDATGGKEIERLVEKGENVVFREVALSERAMKAGDSFTFTLTYECTKAYDDVEVDVAVYDDRDAALHHQASNAAYDKPLHLLEGTHQLEVTVHDIRIHGSSGCVVLSIWAGKRVEHLLWWRVPVAFDAVPHATGRNFLPTTFEVRS